MKYQQIMVVSLCCVLAVAGGNAGSVTLAAERSVSSGRADEPDDISGVGETALTAAQETAPAVTESPATSAPAVTESPATSAPAVTEPPATDAPAGTEPPATDAPAGTEPPATSAPATDLPSELPPATDPSDTEPLVTELPWTDLIEDPEAPGTEAPPQLPTETTPESGSGTESTESTDTEPQEGESADTEPLLGESEDDETETDTDEEDLIESDQEDETKAEGKISNEELIARQNIVTPPPITLEFRFTQVEKVGAVARKPEGALIYEKMSSSSTVVGRLKYCGICYILEDDGDWLYVESGEARGFVATDDLEYGGIVRRLQKAKGGLPEAVATVDRLENAALTHTHTTVYPVVADREYALASEELNIYESTSSSARVTGTLEEGGLCYVLADGERYWIFVESGNVRGFAQASQLIRGSQAADAVKTNGEGNLALADLAIAPEDNAACYYTLTSVKKASASAALRSEIVNFSFQFLGNPYVWGGTSLTDGCDCSGFVQSIYAHFGYGLPRVAEAQAVCGMQIPVSSAVPGDLIFYARNGYVYHVSMYVGDGQVIHAYSRTTGIILSGIGSDAVWATRLIEDETAAGRDF